MTMSGQFIPSDDIHPIDIVETVASHYEWDFDRLADDQIAMVVEGQWRNYSLTLAWSAREEVLRLICTYEMEAAEDRLPMLYEVLNLANDQVWDGSFSFWVDQKLMVWRYGLLLAGESVASAGQVDQMIGSAIAASERFYPSFQLACWGNTTARAAVEIALNEAYGRA